MKRVLALLAVFISFQAIANSEVFLFPEKNIFENKAKAPESLFMNLSSNPQNVNAEPKRYKELLKKLATVHVNSHVEIGLDKIKAAPLALKSPDFITVDTHKHAGKSSGYGVGFRIKLD